MAKYRHFQKNKVKESKVAQSCPTLRGIINCCGNLEKGVICSILPREGRDRTTYMWKVL